MRDLLVLLVHLLTTLARLLGPGGARAVVAETLLVKHQLVILNRPRRRAPNLSAMDRIVMGLCTLFMNPNRVRKVAATLKPATLLGFHRALKARKYSRLFSSQRTGRAGPKGPSKELIEAIVEMKRRNPRYGCPRIAEQIAKVFGVEIDKDVVRRVLAKYYRPGPGNGGPSWLTCSERHLKGDELVQILAGSTHFDIIVDDDKQTLELTAGMLVVVPRGCWHRFRSDDGVTVLTATPRSDEQHTFVDDPRAM